MSQDDAPLVWVVSTAPDLARARELARSVVDERLAACVNIAPGATSIYRWRGALEEASEALVFIKTVPARLAELERRWRELHSYEVPEFVVLDARHVASAYLAWVIEETAR